MTDCALKRILVFDDKPDISAITKITLGSIASFIIEICHSGKDTLMVIPDFKSGLFLLDVMMPGLDGRGTFNLIRELPVDTEIPVIFVTANNQPFQLAKYKGLGVIDVIAKPFDLITVSDKIKNIFDNHHA